MLSKKTRGIIFKTTVAMMLSLSTLTLPQAGQLLQVEASQTAIGTVTVKASSIWTYSRPDWNAKTKAYAKGTSFTALEKIKVAGRDMYRLNNGLYISANTAYVSFNASAGSQPVTVPAENATISTGTGITSANLNMRSGAGTGNRIVVTIPKGKTVTIHSTSGGWSHVTYNGRNGYVSATYLTGVTSPESSVPTPAPAPVPQTPVSDNVKTTANVNMRKGAGTGHGILLTIPKGKEVTVSGTSNGWSQVTYGGKTGWVSGSYLTKVASPSSPAPVNPDPVPSPVVTTGRSIATANVNMRKGAGTNNGIVLTVPKNKEVTVHSTSGGWVRATYNGKTGYISVQYLKVISPVTSVPTPVTPETPIENPAAPEVIGTSATTYNLNMRKGAGTGQAILLTIPKGQTVSILSTSNGWSEVTYSGKRGWVSSEYLTIMKPVQSPAPKPEEPKPETPAPEAPIPETPKTEEPKPEAPKPVEAVLKIEDRKSDYQNTNVVINGHALTKDGIKAVSASVNGREVEVVRVERPELKTTYAEGYDHAGIGFTVTIDKTTLSQGSHTLKVTAVSNDGSTKTDEVSFKMVKPVGVISIEGITDGQAVPSALVEVKGFALNIDGVAEVSYFINGRNMGKAAYGAASPGAGVYSAYTDYQQAGYSFTLDPKNLSATGMNALRVELAGKDGTMYAKTVVLKGTETSRYTGEVLGKTRDEYAAVEYNRNSSKMYSSAKKGFIDASLHELQFHMDAANFIYDDAYKFMFMDLTYKKGDLNVTVESLDRMLAGKGVLSGQGEAFLTAAENHSVNPFYLIAHAILETGHGKSVLAQGQLVKDTYTKFGDVKTIVPDSVPLEDQTRPVYNVFGIGAYDSNPNLWGGQKAYELKWFTVRDAIIGGASWIGSGYINATPSQNTLFKMRYNFPYNMTHQYATDVAWAKSQSSIIKAQITDYNKANSTEIELNYIYPVFK